MHHPETLGVVVHADVQRQDSFTAFCDGPMFPLLF